MYTFILIKKETGAYLGWSKAKDMPPCGEPDKLEWVAYTDQEAIEAAEKERGEDGQSLYHWDGAALVK